MPRFRLRPPSVRRRRLTRGLAQSPPPPPPPVGAAPGLSVADLRARAGKLPADAAAARLTLTDFGPDHLSRTELDAPPDTAAWPAAPERAAVRWVHLDRAGDLRALAALAERFALPSLVNEDLVNLHQRAKLERIEPEHDDDPADLPGPVTAPPQLLLMLRMVESRDDRLHSEQVALLIGEGLVVTVTEDPGDVWAAVRKRLNRKQSRLRRRDAGFLAYALVDAVVDALVPALDLYDRRLEELDRRVRQDPDAGAIESVHALRHELAVLRREQRAVGEAIQHLTTAEAACLSDDTRVFLRDVIDHHRRALDLLDTAHDTANHLADAWANAVTLRDSEIMRLLTLVASIFIPLSFLAGVFGMNFRDMPLLDHPAGLWVFVALCVAVAAGMLLWFKRRGWL